MRRFAGVLIVMIVILQGVWIAYKLLIENTPEFPNLILPFGLISIAAAFLKWSKEPCKI